MVKAAASRQVQLRLKRAIDIVVSGALIVLTFPFYVVIYLAIRLTMGSPVLFRQKRPGLNGQIFTVQKFRTMINETERDGRRLTDAERVNRLGRLLRKTSLDEIPQLYNVFRGEMSLVGPRPLLPEYLPKYTPEQMRRHEMRPGITGWAQVNGRNNTLFSERFKMDVWYVDHCSLWVDVKIIVRTVLNVIYGRGVVTGQNVFDVDDLGFNERSRQKARIDV